ncbi:MULTISPECIES: DUF2087 domain-containing protein [Streptomyces]|uniref:DUF2087 domain-containing protein n=1 Tax=Streptomyces venezuelae (strain ATCC 10712 / CBS 650.69 / DSM 40230 / JCM 4526 / NBRC 13096 / PD 04745) TaxID=953739 RepID=F2RH58_STRVP|nr:DUF2087 domain-containing protein [Streptomyces venezuelae]APE23106.1 hypothetical protein vnz_20240 [Streptomyces venezuelae]QES00487.1 DUF2087 domain-containing protein [Streptomyces venezuelae ATCC 10712]QES13755.1 DUF2087 domain-containing protein [Streptomyces venezuelae]CCA57386.1 hypothetical protein SVEN_4100 [Streptomyces venezuelae ATCC 10712]
MTSHPSRPAADSRSVADLFSADGRLKAIPRRPARREALLAHLTATLFEDGRDYREPEINEALLTVHEDFSALRRYLVIGGFLARTKDGSAYRRQQQPGSPGGAIPAVA